MKIKKCCNEIEGILELDFININYYKELIYMNDKFGYYIMKYCPNCGEIIKFFHEFKAKEDDYLEDIGIDLSKPFTFKDQNIKES